ncbi:hypothetical protein DUNSADRAFT_13628 [Dunaliella salina]|uniref:Encoded protein n=1 Tax=Dunaliella salina TaxID=3046 RepID=A0ABQ7G929_DUNSA|nr:hypothetical protein DUNSADRAFT_13628 [Dunaliella salina]|eukprot:KAF5831072.1 hypothetical protein DUNSADRAFT_13628 [Dunaliella salina]
MQHFPMSMSMFVHFEMSLHFATSMSMSVHFKMYLHVEMSMSMSVRFEMSLHFAMSMSVHFEMSLHFAMSVSVSVHFEMSLHFASCSILKSAWDWIPHCLAVNFGLHMNAILRCLTTRQKLPVSKTVSAVKLANVVLPVAAVVLGSIWEKALFNVGCIFVVLNIFRGGWDLTSDAPWNLKVLLISLVLCTIGWVIHAHPEFLARAFGLT